MKFANVYKNYTDGQEIFRRPSVTILFEEIQAERAKSREYLDERTALIIYNRRIRIVITLCVKAFDLLDAEGGLFVPQIVKDTIKQAREQVTLLDNSLASSLEICENAPTLVTADAKNAPLNS